MPLKNSTKQIEFIKKPVLTDTGFFYGFIMAKKYDSIVFPPYINLDPKDCNAFLKLGSQ